MVETSEKESATCLYTGVIPRTCKRNVRYWCRFRVVGLGSSLKQHEPLRSKIYITFFYNYFCGGFRKGRWLYTPPHLLNPRLIYIWEWDSKPFILVLSS